MRLSILTVVLGVLGVLCLADDAWAWGPAMHIGLAASVMERLYVLPAAVGALLARRSIAYLYGNIAADIVFAKRWSRIKQFCHHWSTGFALLDSARDESGKAFALGYLSHLAADTVAHGKYVPRQIALSESTVGVGHFYWELRADAAQADRHWRLLERVVHCDHEHHHRLLETHIQDTFLPFELNRLLFDRMHALAARQAFRRTMSVWSQFSRTYLPPELMSGYREECLERIHSILTEGRHSPVTREDPNGTSALMEVRVRRRELRRLRRRGMPIELRLLEASRGLAPRPLRYAYADSA